MRWIIGDVHGMLRPLRALLEEIGRRDADARLFFCGDYCDRGPDTRAVVDLLVGLSNARFVRGNHDDVFDLCLHGQSFATGPNLGGEVPDSEIAEIAEMFLREGLRQTLESYGSDPEQLEGLGGDTRAVFDWVRKEARRVPGKHRDFFRELPAVQEEDGFFVCHATWPADYMDANGRMNGMLAGDPYLRHDVLWGRYNANQVRSVKVWGRRGYFGHTPTDNYLGQDDLLPEPGRIVRGEKVVLMDTAIFAPGGRLSAVCHDSDEVIQATQEGEVLE